MKTITLILSGIILGSAVLLAGSEPRSESEGNYQPVLYWPRIPSEFRFGQVTGIAVDSEDRIYVFHRGKKPITVFDRSGKFLRSWGDGLIKTAHGLRIDSKDNVWVTDLGTHLVMKFDNRGKLLLTVGKKGQPGNTKDKFNKPADVGVTSSGVFYVADGYGNNRVVKFAKDGSYLKEWGKRGKGNGEFHLPHSICVDTRGRVYVGDRENNRVQVFDSDGNYLAQWSKSGAPYGLSLHGKKMFLADGRANVVKLLNLEGKTLYQWGSKGIKVGQFKMPHWVCVDSRGAVYVAEVNGKRVQKFEFRKGA